MLKDIKALLLDVQGTLTTRDEHGRNILVGGVRLIEHARRTGRRILVLTNATKRNEAILNDLRGAGLPLEDGEILSAGQATGLYLREKRGACRLWILGERSLGEELAKYGHEIVNDTSEKPHFVVVGLDRELTFEKLNTALAHLRSGAELIGCHASKRIPEKDREIISVGPIVKALEYASDKQAIIIGKPSRVMYEMALAKLRVNPHEALMISDELKNDLLPAKDIGMKTALTLTGVTKRQDLERSEIKPDIVVENIDDLVSFL
ncbi:MAG TPA: HAD-IIA family hydrolase [Candidatus Caldiarchaeum subterraneum]|uniref:HAD-IIA family hydrolase n=1 Tax=Caldiarchaeum subterraneum TaxID=311458 RepID=A0A832ZVT3_CALS0|nr:HAD-IIA family hydrolase [Candidatus Caldarchaeum subterraneum]